MFNQIFENIEGIEIYPIISFVIFFLFFIAVTVWIFRMDKSYVKQMEVIPLDEDSNINKDPEKESYVKK
ncbi:MAG: cbb3-type cytochrome c oxidase subunit 3 [Ignavibacteriae bacterium]|nr:MAG: cbb3-type cytochrome c oxidase subunit 3 [Ignavibacteriota bacterium]